MGDEMYTVYGHRFPNGKLYIGMTKRKLSHRFGKEGKNYQHCSAMYRAIQEYGWENVEHFPIICCESKEDAEWYEAFLIYKKKTMDPQFGYNMMPGGKVKGHLPEESKRKISDKNKASWANDPAKKQVAAERMRKRMEDPAYREKVLAAMKNAPHKGRKGVTHKSNRRKKVVQMNKDRTVIKVWDSMLDVQNAGIATRQAISLCCLGKTGTCRGYLWEFYSEYIEKLDTAETV